MKLDLANLNERERRMLLIGGIAAVVLLEIVVDLTVTAGLSDLTLRDVGVLGLAVCLTGISSQPLPLRR